MSYERGPVLSKSWTFPEVSLDVALKFGHLFISSKNFIIEAKQSPIISVMQCTHRLCIGRYPSNYEQQGKLQCSIPSLRHRSSAKAQHSFL